MITHVETFTMAKHSQLKESNSAPHWMLACLITCTALIIGCSGGGDGSGSGSIDGNIGGGAGDNVGVSISPSENLAGTVFSADQQTPTLVLSSGSGISELLVDSRTGALSGRLSVMGLSSPARIAHIHRGVEGSNGPVVIALNINEDDVSFDVPNGSALDAVGIDNYLNAELYVDVHTDLNPAGEIRAQLIPVDATGRTRFSIEIRNVSTDSSLSTPSTGGTVAVPLSPGAYLIHSSDTNPFVENGLESDEALEALAEDGNPYFLRAQVQGSGAFDTPDGAFTSRPINPGEKYTFSVTAAPGDKLSLLSMFVQSNDWFYSTHNDTGGISLFDENGVPISGDVSDMLTLWESGTEQDQEPGTGSAQVLRQDIASETGTVIEDGRVGSLADQGKLETLLDVLNTQVIKVSITLQPL